MTINFEQVDNVIRNIIFTINALSMTNNQLESEASRLSKCNGTKENPHNHSAQIASIRKIIYNNKEKIEQLKSICEDLKAFKENAISGDKRLADLIDSPEKFAAYMAGVLNSYGQISINSKSDYDMFMEAKELVEVVGIEFIERTGVKMVDGMKNKYNINLADGKMDCIRCQSTKAKDGEYPGWYGCVSTSLAAMLRINNGISADVPANKIIISESNGTFPKRTSQEYSDFSFETYANLEQDEALSIIKEQLYDNKVCVVKLDNGSGEDDGHTVVCSGIRNGISLADATWDDLLFNDVGRTDEDNRKGKVMAEMSYQGSSGKVKYSVPEDKKCCVRIDTSK
ncbi:MAG: hypothetical protein ACI4KD_04790 [Oscillospiraceae bacterium]